MARKAEIERNTLETKIKVSVDLDGTGASALQTGMPFLEHMLDQVARHGMIDLRIEAEGDLHIDGHHTAEDIGITLGQAVAQAVGDKKGIRRYGHAYVPLDEALSRVVVDFSGRPGLEFGVDFPRARIGFGDGGRTCGFAHIRTGVRHRGKRRTPQSRNHNRNKNSYNVSHKKAHSTLTFLVRSCFPTAFGFAA